MPNPTPTQRLNTLEPRIADIERMLGSTQRPPTAPVLKRVWNSVLANPAASTIVTILVFVFGLATTQIKGWFDDAVSHRVENILKERGGTLERLDKLQATVEETNVTLKTLQPFIQDLVRHQFEALSKLSPQNMGMHLPKLGNLADAARSQNVRIDSEIIDDLSQKLLKVDSHATEYWPTTAKLISYKSTGWSSTSQLSLPDCANTTPSPSKLLNSVSPGLQTLNFSHRTYANCVFTLDSKRDQEKINELLRTDAWDLVFKNCVIQYRGGPVNLILEVKDVVSPLTLGAGSPNEETVMVRRSGPTLLFDNCLLKFYLPIAPPLNVQRIAQSLLAQNGPSLKLPDP